ELVHHRVDRVFQLENLAANVHCDLAREVPAGHGRGHVGDVADLTRQVGSHRVDVIGQIFACAGDSRHLRLSAELAFGADLARDAADFGSESIELIDHGVDGVLELENLAFNVDGDFSRQISAGDGGCDVGDIANLAGQVGSHRIHVVGK